MTQSLHDQALALYREGLEGVRPELLLRRSLSLDGESIVLRFSDGEHRLSMEPEGRLRVLAVGKAAAPLAIEAHRLLGTRVARGLVVTKEGFALPDVPWPQHECGHPIPDERGMAAAAAAEELAHGLTEIDVLLVLVSGGASALLPAPVPGVDLQHKQALMERMLRKDLDIHQINRVRKTLSRLKGGGLARAASPARVVGLYLSDVPGDVLGSIGSGPTVPEEAVPAAAVALLREQGLWAELPPGLRRVLESARTPPDNSAGAPPLNGVIGTNGHLLEAVAGAAECRGIQVHLLDTPVTGNVADAREFLLSRWHSLRQSQPAAPIALICGGETTVVVRGRGRGGRCQELAALMMPRLEPGTVFLAAGSDGNDGPTDAAGGVVDGSSWQHVNSRNIPYEALLADNDSYHLLERCGGLIRVAPTRNNLMDLYMFLGEGAG